LKYGNPNNLVELLSRKTAADFGTSIIEANRYHRILRQWRMAEHRKSSNEKCDAATDQELQEFRSYRIWKMQFSIEGLC